MAHSEALSPTDTVAKRVREVRKRRGLTAEQLADKLREQGVLWDRYTVTKLENGKRQNITLSEWLTLAAVLNVAPTHLLLPVDGGEEAYQVTPTRTERVEQVRGWVRGHWPLPGANVIQFQAEMPEEEQGKIHLPPTQDRAARIDDIERSMAQLSTALQHLRGEGADGEGL
ncbi:hypothetical protein MBT84_32925 [Streptomyces sp. MBT84]|uniref:helix-turn-helix domain-containing protein n=1 Tax=Streptomyces sp. MBT84 TaxID=1488414 RepID=UPI001C6E29F4|nr:helix-turn-helix transcriptional regulator [Streptomyces sp. MBT84]MBW8704414.1 hypothetical protein [Streptomyces sp. MBT84]